PSPPRPRVHARARRGRSGRAPRTRYSISPAGAKGAPTAVVALLSVADTPPSPRAGKREGEPSPEVLATRARAITATAKPAIPARASIRSLVTHPWTAALRPWFPVPRRGALGPQAKSASTKSSASKGTRSSADSP